MRLDILIFIRGSALYWFEELALFKIKSINFITIIKKFLVKKIRKIYFRTLLQQNKDHKMNIDNQKLGLVLAFELYDNFQLENEIQYND
jgi:hypothetical protein